MRINVLGVGFDNLTLREAIDRGAALLDEAGCHYAVSYTHLTLPTSHLV